MKAGCFKLPSPSQLIEKGGIIIVHSNFTQCYFTSNYLPIKARLPRDKETVVNLIHKVVSTNDTSLLRPEYLRGL
jgi:hypothetical protein